uniref:EF-hand domain-containing protein n=1 Tax=Daucus carota subsp. sativus TaxID=79200 RepID=A0A162A925_DAUCS
MERVLARTAISVVFLVFLSSIEVQGRNSHFSSPDHLVSDGSVTNDGAKQGNKTGSSILQLKGLDSSEEQCEHMYGFLPCSESVFGHLFLIIVYEYLLYHGETYLLSGGGRIFEILGTGFFGASAFPVIAQLPESLILLVTGLFSSDEGAQENVLTGVGMVAGSTIFNLTLLWGTCLFLGRQVFVNKTNSIPVSDPSAESQQKKPPSLLSGYGVTSDAETSFTAKIMLVSVVPFIIILAPKIFNVSYNSRAYNIDILVTLFALIVLLLAYFSYQFSHSSIQDRRLDYLKVEHQTHVLAVINHVQEYVPERLLDDHGAPNEDAISRLFQKLDKDGDQQLSHAELTELFNRIKLSKSVLSREKVMENILNELDHDGNEQISLTEFMKTVKHWLHTTMCAVDEPASHSHDPGQPIKHLDEIYDGVFMNNVLGFSVLLSVVYFRGLVWHFSAEVMIVVIVCSVMGLIASFISRFPVWIMFIAYSLYPLSLIIVYLVDDYFWLP